MAEDTQAPVQEQDPAFQPQEVELTLNRWHKVVERLTLQLSHVDSQLRDAGAPVRVNLIPGSDLRSFDADIQKFDSLLAEYQLLGSTIYTIKSAVGVANAQLGISDKIAMQAALRKQANAFRRAMASMKGTGVTQDEAKNLLKVLTKKAIAEEGTNSLQTAVMVKLFTDEQVAMIDTNIVAIERNINRIADEVSDLNKEKIKLNIAAYAVAVAGLEVKNDQSGQQADGGSSGSTASNNQGA